MDVVDETPPRTCQPSSVAAFLLAAWGQEMSDQFTRVTRETYLERLGASFAGMLAGLVLLLAAPVLLFWNDGRAVEAERALNAAGRGAVSLPGPAVDPANEGRLVHFSGPAETATPASVGDIPVALPPALVLTRSVEMYQWTQTSQSESREKMGGTRETVTTYSYSRAWSGSSVESGSFAEPSAERTNPPMPYSATATQATNVAVGGFSLAPDALAGLSASAVVVPEAAPEGWRLTATGLYRGAGTPEAPQVGDLRVSYGIVPVGTVVSVLGRQSGTALEAWSPPGSNYGLIQIVAGAVPAEAMIGQAQEAESVITWVLRGVGTVLAIIAFGLLLAPLKALANVIPPVAWLIGSGTGLVAVALGLAVSLVTIGIAWLVFRPLFGLALIAAAAGAWWLLKGRPGAARTAAA